MQLTFATYLFLTFIGLISTACVATPIAARYDLSAVFDGITARGPSQSAQKTHYVEWMHNAQSKTLPVQQKEAAQQKAITFLGQQTALKGLPFKQGWPRVSTLPNSKEVIGFEYFTSTTKATYRGFLTKSLEYDVLYQKKGENWVKIWSTSTPLSDPSYVKDFDVSEKLTQDIPLSVKQKSYNKATHTG